ncbi:MAG: 23S rRNA (guanosine(2251)-2'-O)-methyltransferase RlmB [Spirochaetaceae bacterium]|jgi:23S rRNA (guanosine2251-2'-O)-methyltransferase|nr:23S rRNA (guanosine(2251)-2'-O)-methyltransferase RlmB [Spirochaetaceae bacterium]
MVYLTGFHAIEERIKSGRGCGALLVAKTGPRGGKIVNLAVKTGTPLKRSGSHELDSLAPDNRGIALEVEDSAAANSFDGVDGFLASLPENADALAVILDEITDPHNYGAILRSCEQFAVDVVITRNRRIAKNAAVISKTSAGADAWVKVVEAPNLQRAAQDLKDAGFWIYGADMRGEPLYTKKAAKRTALVLGGEAGLSRLLKESCDATLSIPSLGKIDSLNVSVAAGIFLYEVYRQKNAV